MENMDKLAEDSKRYSSISYIRIMAMLMIITCHVFQYYDHFLAWWFNVGVQIFLVISGYLYGTKNITNYGYFIEKQLKKIVIPFWSWIVIITIFYSCVSRQNLSFLGVIKAFTGAVPYVGLEHLWFIPYILACYFITPLLNSLKQKFENKGITYVFIVVSLICILLEVLSRCYVSYFKASRISCYILGYFLSYTQNREYTVNREEKKYVLLTLTILGYVMNAIRIIVLLYLGDNLTGIAKSLFNLYEEYAHVFLGISIFITLLSFLKKTKESVLSRIGDKYSYYIYITHHIFVLSSFSILNLKLIMPIRIVLVICAIAVSSFVLEILSSIFNKMLLAKSRS